MTETRTGFGYDAHAFGGDGPVVLGGVAIPHDMGVEATSDGDVVSHAVCDAVLGVAALGDIGQHFPSCDASSTGADSLAMLSECVRLVNVAGWNIVHVDVTVVVQEIRIAPHRDSMRANVAAALAIEPSCVSVKATTTDRLGWIGSGQGIASYAIVTASKIVS
jgi:2-C-methyl-D-erythritol 2,4-cyclodiphosphate synthase